MGWKKLQDGVTPGWYEDITTEAGGTTDKSSSIIDFIPSGTTFTVVYNTEAVATNSQNMDVAIDGATDKAGTFSEIKADLIANQAGSAVAAASYVPATTGVGMPLYKVRLDPDGDANGAVVRIAVIPLAMNAADASGMGTDGVDIGGVGADPS
tara:strand:+ start:451 stop:909 length:459 start_codon:yes stop_codon:yes gene_type:complete